MSTFAEVVRMRAGDERVGVVFGDQRWTWAEVVQEAADRAASLSAMSGEGHQLHLGVLLENIPDYLFWTCAAALAGAVVVCINPTRRGPELAGDILHTGCDVIITEDSLAGLLAGLDHGVPGEQVLNVDTAGYAEFLRPYRDALLPAELPGPAAILLLLFSSGSTGAPKAVICSQGRLRRLAQTLQGRAELTSESVSLQEPRGASTACPRRRLLDRRPRLPRPGRVLLLRRTFLGLAPRRQRELRRGPRGADHRALARHRGQPGLCHPGPSYR